MNECEPIDRAQELQLLYDHEIKEEERKKEDLVVVLSLWVRGLISSISCALAYIAAEVGSLMDCCC